ncbi:MAG: hypothetical protein FWD59_00465 [Micrococcales bacterium]|nr:hypothetical protein [Micrococcales bacterium]
MVDVTINGKNRPSDGLEGQVETPKRTRSGRSGNLLVASAVLLIVAALSGVFVSWQSVMLLRDTRYDALSVTILGDLEEFRGRLNEEISAASVSNPDQERLTLAQQASDKQAITLTTHASDAGLIHAVEDQDLADRLRSFFADPVKALNGARPAPGGLRAVGLEQALIDMVELADLCSRSITDPVLAAHAIQLPSLGPNNEVNDPARSGAIAEMATSARSLTTQATARLVTDLVMTVLGATGAVLLLLLSSREKKRREARDAEALERSLAALDDDELNSPEDLAEGDRPGGPVLPVQPVLPVGPFGPDGPKLPSAPDLPTPPVPAAPPTTPPGPPSAREPAPFDDSFPPVIAAPRIPTRDRPEFRPRAGAGLSTFPAAAHPVTGAHEDAPQPPAIPGRLDDSSDHPTRLSDAIREAAASVGQPHRMWVTERANPDLTQDAHPLIVEILKPLLNNAIRFSPPASRIRITTRETPTAVRIDITDEGTGLDPETARILTAALANPHEAHRLGTRGLPSAAQAAAHLGARVGLVPHKNAPGTTAVVLLPTTLP